MRWSRGLGMFAGAVLACSAPALTQLSDPQRDRLAAGEVVPHEGHLYAMATGSVRGTREGTEQMLITRAMRSIAHQLCDFEASPNRRLEARLTGVTLVSSTAQGRDLEVVVQAPPQKPNCRIVAVEPAPPPRPATAPEEARSPGTGAGEKGAQDIQVRSFGGEH